MIEVIERHFNSWSIHKALRFQIGICNSFNDSMMILAFGYLNREYVCEWAYLAGTALVGVGEHGQQSMAVHPFV